MNTKTPGDARDGDALRPLPALRRVTVIAQDPSVLKHDGTILMATIQIPAEELIAGPMGYRVHVVDYDASRGHYFGAHVLPVSIEDEPAHWGKGHARIVHEPRFHAQNAYALVMKTLARFEHALGRRVGWSFGTHQLKVAPHGMVDANAFYSPHDEGLVFGYFAGRSSASVYTCLSHDVVVHETAHALIDALRERYLDPSSPDQAALHEGLADVIALLSVFSQPEVLRELLRTQCDGKPGEKLIATAAVTAKALREGALFKLAKEMGSEIQGSRGNALRHSTTLEPDPKVLDRAEFLEPHRRGEVLVAAVMHAFVEAWAARLETLQVEGQSVLPLARVAEEGATIADVLATMWIRGLDYMPPVHVTFGDALSGALTADLELRPDDTRFHLRDHARASFRAYGIEPASDCEEPEFGVWKRAPEKLAYDRVRFESLQSDEDEVFRFLWENRVPLKLRDGAYTRVLTVRPCIRIGPDGFALRETVAQYYQVARLTIPELKRKGIVIPSDYAAALRAARRKPAKGDGAIADEPGDAARDEPDDEATTPLYGGGVLVFDEFGRLKYRVSNDVFHKKLQKRRLAYLWSSGQLRAGPRNATMKSAQLSSIHRLRAVDARDAKQEGW